MQQSKHPSPRHLSHLVWANNLRINVLICALDDVLEQNEGCGPWLHKEERLLHHHGGHDVGVCAGRPDLVWQGGQQRWGSLGRRRFRTELFFQNKSKTYLCTILDENMHWVIMERIFSPLLLPCDSVGISTDNIITVEVKYHISILQFLCMLKSSRVTFLKRDIVVSRGATVASGASGLELFLVSVD